MHTEQASINLQHGEQPSLLPHFGIGTCSPPKIFDFEIEQAAQVGKEQTLKRLKRILDKLTFENFDLLKSQLESGITTPEMLVAVVKMIFNKAVFQPLLCPIYARLCADLNEKLPSFPPEKDGERAISFKRTLLNKCQEAFEGADNMWSEISKLISPDQEMEHRGKERIVKLWTIGNIQLIGELWKEGLVPDKIVHHIVRELLGPDMDVCPTDVNVEAICQLFTSIGEQFDENPISSRLIDRYFNVLKKMTTNPLLTPRLRFMVLNVLDLRANNWVVQREEAEVDQFKSAAYRAVLCLRKAVSVFEEYEEGHRGRRHVPFDSNAFYFAATCAVLLCIVCLILGIFIGKRL